MRFDEKARENLEAAERLLPGEDGLAEALSNASVSRAYYAAYLAVADRAQRVNRAFTDRNTTYYRHDTLPDDAYRWRIIGDDHRDDLRWLRDLRIKADYYEDQVTLEEASEALDVAAHLVGVALEEGQR
jgi:uncharacterized protein (UPF0332 family)